MPSGRFVSGTCVGERCNFRSLYRITCGEPAEHKVEEAIAHDDPNRARHPYTAYVCHRHFKMIMGLK